MVRWWLCGLAWPGLAWQRSTPGAPSRPGLGRSWSVHGAGSLASGGSTTGPHNTAVVVAGFEPVTFGSHIVGNARCRVLATSHRILAAVVLGWRGGGAGRAIHHNKIHPKPCLSHGGRGAAGVKQKRQAPTLIEAGTIWPTPGLSQGGRHPPTH